MFHNEHLSQNNFRFKPSEVDLSGGGGGSGDGGGGGGGGGGITTASQGRREMAEIFSFFSLPWHLHFLTT